MKRVTRFLHLWLGLISGGIVFVIALTGSLLVFQDDLSRLMQSCDKVSIEKGALLPPSVLRRLSDKALPGKKIHSIIYRQPGNSARAVYYNDDPEYYYMVYLHPFNGSVLKVKNMDHDFFRIMVNGHYYLWLPPSIGKPLVAGSTLIFVILLITGLILWWPRHRNAVKPSLTLKWKTGWKRKNYDLHNVLGFYVTLLALIIAFTGLVWGFQWFAKALYWTASGGRALQDYSQVFSDTTRIQRYRTSPVDLLWQKTLQTDHQAASIEVHFPETSKSTIDITVNPEESTYWKADYRYYDQYSLKEVKVNHLYGRFHHEISPADKLMRMNYDIHTGQILGLPGKILAFLVSLVCASLPVTGFYIWWNKRSGRRKSLINDLD